MNLECKTWLKDIQLAIEEIYEFLPLEMNFIAFQKDIKTRKAVERNIEIIGEAMVRILNKEPDIQITDSRKIVDTRNRIIHGYDTVSADVLWLIIKKNLPVLATEVNNLL